MRHGYDLIVITEPIDTSDLARSRSANWQKLLILERPDISNYERVIWLDSDILINSEAPCITSMCSESSIGVVLYRDIQDASETALHHERWAAAASESAQHIPRNILRKFFDNYYAAYGLNASTHLRFNTGVLVLTPRRHASFLKHVYFSHQRDAFDKEQTALNFELVQANCYQVLDRRFNIQVADELLIHYPFIYFRAGDIGEFCNNANFGVVAGMCLANIFEKSFFYHSCGSSWCIGLLHEFLRGTEWRQGEFRNMARKLWNP